LRRLEPGAPTIKERLGALAHLHEAGVHVQLRLWPYAPDLAGDLPGLLRAVKDAGVRTVLANPLKLYHHGGREGINRALGRDYMATSPIRYVNGGVFSIASFEDQKREMGRLADLCRSLGMDMLSCDDWPHVRNWRDCCGCGDLPGFKPSPWAYYVRGHVIGDHTDFETYMSGHDCPFAAEFEQEWNDGKLSRAVPGLQFHEEDKTYSSMYNL
jgi:hypothetical protein